MFYFSVCCFNYADAIMPTTDESARRLLRNGESS